MNDVKDSLTYWSTNVVQSVRHRTAVNWEWSA